MSCELRGYLGAYAVGALTPEEFERVSDHLGGCAECDQELRELAWLPAVLLRVPPGQVDRMAAGLDADPAEVRPSPALLNRLLARAGAERRARRRRVALAAVAAVLIGTAGGVAASTLPSQSHAPTVTAVDPRTHVKATVTIAERSWGTALTLSLRGAYPGGVCSLIAHGRDGRTEVAATWVASPQGTAEVPGSTAIPADQLTQLDVVSAGRQLVRVDVPTNR